MVADQKTTELALFVPTFDSLIYGVVDPGGTPASRKMSVEGARSTIAQGVLFETRADVQGATINATVNVIAVGGCASAGDGGGALYKRVGSQPSHALKIQSGDGAWWELVPDTHGYVNTLQNGVVMDSRLDATANTTALQGVIDAAASLGAILDLGPGSIFIDGRISMDAPVHIVGRGNTRWPQNSAARRSTTQDEVTASPSQIVFTDTGTRDQTILGISSMRNCGADRTNLSTQSGYNDSTYRLLSFVNDSTTTTRTQKSVSIAWHVQTGAFGSIFKDFRIVLDAGGSDGLDGYFGVIAASVAWSSGESNWDIGIYNDTTPNLVFDNIQVVGPWQMAGYLLTITPSDGDFSTTTFNLSPYDCVHHNCVFEGYKGVSIRGSDTFQIVALTSSTVSVPWADDHPFAASGSMFLAQNQNATTEFDYTGITKVAATGGNPDLLRFDGLVDNPDTVYDPGNNVIPYNKGGSSGIKFEQCRFGGMHHPSGFPCHYASLGVPKDNPGGGVEISGRLIVEITFTDWQIQHNEQIGFHLHHCRELYFSESGQAEGNTPTGDTKSGLRFIATPHHTVTTDEVLLSLVVAGGGTGYSAGDILTVVGGTFGTVAKIVVDTETAGVIDTASVFIPGMYSVTPSNDVAVTDSGNSDATFTLTWVEQYTNGDTFNIYVGSFDLIFGDGNDFRPKIPILNVQRWLHAEDVGHFNPNFVRVPGWAVRSDTDQGTGVVAPVGGKVGILKSTAPTSGNRIPTSHDPEYAMYYDDTLDFMKFGQTGSVPQEKFHFQSGVAADDQGLRFTGFRPHVTFEDASGGATDFQVWVDGNVLSILYGDVSVVDKLGTSLIDFLEDIIKPGADNTVSFGTLTKRWKEVFADVFMPGAGTVIWTSGSGTPESAVTAPIGSLYTDTGGSTGTTLYVKESGAGNTGWVAKSSQTSGANQAALTDSTGATADGTISALPAGGTGTAAGGWDTAGNRNTAIATIDENFQELHLLLDEIRTTLVANGMMKGSA